MNELTVIRGVECYIDQDGIVQLNLEHVARGLGFTDTSKGTEYIRWNTVKSYLADVNFSQEVAKDTFIPEPIFYLLAMKANNDTAKQFQKVVAYEILPSIRKHGLYATDELLNNPDLAIKAFTALKEEREKNKLLTAKVEQDKPKVLFADAVETSQTSILIGDLAKLIKQNGYDIGQNRLFKWLRSNDYLIKSGDRKNMPTQTAMNQELFEVKESTFINPDGSIRITKTPKVTGKGQIYFINLFLGKKNKTA